MANTARPSPVVGSTWIWMYHGKVWPVVLCDENQTPEEFLRRRQHASEIPAILLGKKKYIWVLDNSRLVEPFDPTKDYLHGLLPFEQPDIQRKDDTKTTDEKSRRIGLKQDAMASEGAEYWSNVVKQRIEAMRLEAEIELKHSRRRKRSREIEADDYVEELKIVSARRRGAASSSRNETGQQNDRTSPQRLKNKQLITSGHTANEKYGRPIGAAADQPIATGNGGGEDNQYIKESTSLEDKTQHNVDEKDADKKLKTQLAREHNEQTVRDKPPSSNFCTIFIGEEKKGIQISLVAIKNHDFLANKVHYTPDLKSHINLWPSADITPNDFRPVLQYLLTDDFMPRFVSEKSGPAAQLQSVSLPAHKASAAETCAHVFVTASRLHLAALQMLVVEKLRTLSPLPPVYILIIARVSAQAIPTGCEAEELLFVWLVEHVAEYYYVLVRDHGRSLIAVLSQSETMHEAVLRKVVNDPKGCRKGMEE